MFSARNGFFTSAWSPLALSPLAFFDAGNSASYPGSGSTVTDLSGNANDGTLTGTTGYSSADGGQITLATDGYIKITPFETGSKLSGKSQLTISVFAKHSNASTAFFSYGALASFADDIFFYFNAGTILSQVNNGADGAGSFSRSFSSAWTHFVFVFDGTATGNANRLKIYINGVLATLSFSYTVPSSTASPSLPLARIGSYVSFPAGWFLNGSIASFQCYLSALSSSDVSQLFNWGRGRLGI